MGRRTDRRHVFNLIFQMGFSGRPGDIGKFIDEYMDNHVSESVDKDFIYVEFSGTCQNIEDIDKIIAGNLKSWTPDRLNKTDLAILRLAVYEMIYNDDIPASIAINEAVELAKVYSEDESPGFVNAILGGIAKSLDGAKYEADSPQCNDAE